jgi:hypothetical protein
VKQRCVLYHAPKTPSKNKEKKRTEQNRTIENTEEFAHEQFIICSGVCFGSNIAQTCCQNAAMNTAPII